MVDAAACAEPCFAPRRRIGVVLDDDGKVDPAPDAVAQWFFAQVQVGGKDDGGTILVDEPGDTHADSADGAGGVMSREFVNGVADHIGEGVAVDYDA